MFFGTVSFSGNPVVPIGSTWRITVNPGEIFDTFATSFWIMKNPYTKKNNSRFSWAFLVSSLHHLWLLSSWTPSQCCGTGIHLNRHGFSAVVGRPLKQKSNVRVATKEAPQKKTSNTQPRKRNFHHPNSPEICTMCLSIWCGKCLLSLKSKRNPCHGRVMPDSVTVTSVVPVRYLCHLPYESRCEAV